MSSLRRAGSFTPALLPLLFPLVQAIQRTIGDPSDTQTQNVLTECLGQSSSTDPIGFGYGACAHLLRCVSDNLAGDISAGMQSGGTIASLIPTILALVGAPSLDLVQLAFISPHRAIATCIFSIGLPSGLFRQLQVHLPKLADQITIEPRRREWLLQVPSRESTGPARLAKTLLIDLLILAIAGVMVWRNTVICFQTMVTWRCEYSWLLICWPIACAVWLFIAIALLHAFASKIEITFSEDVPGVQRSRLDLLLLHYRSPRTTIGAPAQPAQDKPDHSGPAETLLQHPQKNRDFPHFKIAVTMRHNNSWGWFETMIETMAVGIYLYATFVLSSSMFLSGEQAIIYATIMILGLSAIRVLEAL